MIKSQKQTITKQPWFDEVYQKCVDESYNTGMFIKHINLNGWTFVSHEICERDSFGPVTSLLTMRNPGGQLEDYLI